jgi:hypothetical protein
VAWGTGLTQQTKNTELMFFMATYDIYGNALSQGGAIFLVQITDRFNGMLSFPHRILGLFLHSRLSDLILQISLWKDK